MRSAEPFDHLHQYREGFYIEFECFFAQLRYGAVKRNIDVGISPAKPVFNMAFYECARTKSCCEPGFIRRIQSDSAGNIRSHRGHYSFSIYGIYIRGTPFYKNRY